MALFFVIENHLCPFLFRKGRRAFCKEQVLLYYWPKEVKDNLDNPKVDPSSCSRSVHRAHACHHEVA
jgi:hypothetical protein